MKKITLICLILALFGVLSVSQSGSHSAAANTSPTFTTLIEDFSNGRNPPILNTASFNHNFRLSTAWDNTGLGLYDPLPPSPTFALNLFAGNEDRVTFNHSNPRAYTGSARVWGYTYPAENGLPAGRGRVVFEGSGDTKTVDFIGGPAYWRLFEADETDTGDNGRLLGEIIAVRLIDMGNNGVQVAFDDLEISSVTPPTRSNLSLSMNGSASVLNPGDVITYTLTATNAGPEAAPNTAIRNRLPAGGHFRPDLSDPACQRRLNTVDCALGTLSVNGSGQVTIAVEVGNDACATFFNQATVTAQALDSNMANNTDQHTATTTLPACADFGVSQTALPVPPSPGEDQVTYTIDVTNHGPDTAGGTLTFTTPNDIVIARLANNPGPTCTQTAPDTVTCQLGNTVAGQSHQIYVTGDTLATMSGLQTSQAVVTPSIPDPNLTNNTSRFRFTSDSAYTYTIIGELGVGALAPYTGIGGVAMNHNGEVAFLTYSGSVFDHTTFGIFVGDGTNPLIEIATEQDLPVLTGDLYREIHPFGEVDINVAGTVVFIEGVKRNLPQGGHTPAERNIFTGNGGPLTLIASDNSSSGTQFKEYGVASINNAGRVVATANNRFGGFDEIIGFENGQATLLAVGSGRDYALGGVGQSANSGYVAFYEQPVLGRGINYAIESISPSGFQLQIDQAPGFLNDSIHAHRKTSISDTGGVIYSKRTVEPLSGQIIEQLRIGGNVQLSTLALTNFAPNFGVPVLNNEHRYVFLSSNTSSFGLKGLYTGPHPVSNRVIRVSQVRGDMLFGSRATYFPFEASFDLNDQGQVAFSVALQDGRILIVRADPTAEQDQDGVNDWVELGAPNHGDGNNDGIPDAAQPHVASPKSLDGFYSVTFEVDPNHTLTNVAPIANPSPADGPNISFPYGFFNFEVRDLNPGDATAVTVTLPPWAVVQSWWKYGRTPNNPTPHWYEFTFDGTTGADINGNVVTLYLVDGQRGDDDLTANGIIVDPGGPNRYPYTLSLPQLTR